MISGKCWTNHKGLSINMIHTCSFIYSVLSSYTHIHLSIRESSEPSTHLIWQVLESTHDDYDQYLTIKFNSHELRANLGYVQYVLFFNFKVQTKIKYAENLNYFVILSRLRLQICDIRYIFFLNNSTQGSIALSFYNQSRHQQSSLSLVRTIPQKMTKALMGEC